MHVSTEDLVPSPDPRYIRLITGGRESGRWIDRRSERLPDHDMEFYLKVSRSTLAWAPRPQPVMLGRLWTAGAVPLLLHASYGIYRLPGVPFWPLGVLYGSPAGRANLDCYLKQNRFAVHIATSGSLVTSVWMANLCADAVLELKSLIAGRTDISDVEISLELRELSSRFERPGVFGSIAYVFERYGLDPTDTRVSTVERESQRLWGLASTQTRLDGAP